MIDALRDLLPRHLGGQRWFAGAEPEKVEVVDHDHLAPRLLWMLVSTGEALYQLLLGRAEGEPPEFLNGQDHAVVGSVEGSLWFDALLDPELARALLGRLAPSEEATWVRPMGGEQSNTSLVFDDRLVVKVFRRLHDGPNPDIEVTAALARGGFPHVAAPVAAWERDGRHLAVVQPFLGGGTDGWALALTSLRDYYASPGARPSECGGHFAAEAARLGEVTARMHLALADAFGRGPADTDGWVAGMLGQLDRWSVGRSWAGDATSVLAGLGRVGTPGAAIRVHGDYHLGQVMRTDAGWFVLDFEGEPARPLDERRLPSSPLKDVAGMLRSFDYATAVALRERAEDGSLAPPVEPEEWTRVNRAAFLEAYLATEGVADLLPGDTGAIQSALAAWELDKAVYELGYELSHRPDWVAIPEAAIVRLSRGRTGP